MQERAKATRRSLLEAAARLFAERGYAATSVNDISAGSGRTSGAVYFHYASKEGLAVAVVEDRFATWPQLAQRYADETVPPIERLVALSYDIAHALVEDPVTRAGARLWTERATINAPLPHPFALWTAAATRLLAQARLAGQLRTQVRPACAARTLVCAFYGLCSFTEALDGTATVIDRLSDWWQLTLPSLRPPGHEDAGSPVPG
ncbi:ScbR family autoregulator-binding transcription factor [Streptomyces capoamus]|uniref:ScbR family autoregulator-binding transcription factor n=1 Tax=Streptomyces capoamus TaxID=68183 RepID=UPI003C30E0C0